MPTRVSISHAHEDHTLSSAVATLLGATLALRGDEILNTSQASTGLRPGSSVREALREAMESADVCLVVLTPESAERQFVEFELGGAYFGRRRLYLLLHPSATSPPDTIQVNATRIDRVDEVATLIDAIREDLKLTSHSSTAKTLQAISRFTEAVQAYKPEYTILHLANRLKLQIGDGDVLEWPGPGAIALPCDNRFDMVKAGEGPSQPCVSPCDSPFADAFAFCAVIGTAIGHSTSALSLRPPASSLGQSAECTRLRSGSEATFTKLLPRA